MALFDNAPRSLCILRLSAIGDVCNTIAAVQCIQAQWPETKITWITGKLEAQLINDLPNINVLTFDKKEGISAYRKLWAQLKNQQKGQQFDALLHMQYALRASIVTLGIKAKYTLGFDSTRSQDFQTLFTNVKVPSPSKPHVLDGLLAFVETLGVTDTTPAWLIPYSDADKHWAHQQLISNNVELGQNSQQKQKNLVIVPAASKAYKNWNAQGYIDVIKHAQHCGWNVILAGSPASIEIELANDIMQHCSNVTNLVGKSSIKQMVALIDVANLVIAPDTGPTHIANAMSTPVIGLYAHHNPQRTGPYQYLDYVVSVYKQAIEEEHNKPIEQLDWRSRVKDKNAMNRIKSQQVVKMFDKIRLKLSL